MRKNIVKERKFYHKSDELWTRYNMANGASHPDLVSRGGLHNTPFAILYNHIYKISASDE